MLGSLWLSFEYRGEPLKNPIPRPGLLVPFMVESSGVGRTCLPCVLGVAITNFPVIML